VADPSAALRAIPWRVDGALLLVAVAIAGGVIGKWVGLSNPYFIGPLASSALAAAFSLPITGLPYPLLAAAQILLGVFLGATFDRAFLAGARSFIPAALASTLVLMALCGALGLALVPWTGEAWAVMILSTAPGSITEMALTAKVLQQGVAVVTAFHVLRVVIMMPMAPMIFRVAARVARHYGLGGDSPSRRE
jgi:membrane AbrB-like protein